MEPHMMMCGECQGEFEAEFVPTFVDGKTVKGGVTGGK